MKIYNKVVIDMGTLDVLEEDSYEYDGPLAHCGKGGGGGGDTYDVEYNKRMADIAETQMDMGTDYFDWMWGKDGDYTPATEGHWEDGTTPEITQGTREVDYGGRSHNENYWAVDGREFNTKEEAEDWAQKSTTDKTWVEGTPASGSQSSGPSYMDWQGEMINHNMNLLPQQTQLEHDRMGAEQYLLPRQAQYEGDVFEAGSKLLPSKTDLAIKQNTSALGLIDQETQLAHDRMGAEQYILPNQARLTDTQNQMALNLLPQQTQLAHDRMGAEQYVLPNQARLEDTQNIMALNLLPHQTQVEHDRLGAEEYVLPKKAAAVGEFYDTAREGVDVNSRVSRAMADATQAFMGSEKTLNRSMARTGVAPGSGKFAATQNSNAMNRAKAIGGAATNARVNAEKENFSMLQAASNSSGGGI